MALLFLSTGQEDSICTMPSGAGDLKWLASYGPFSVYSVSNTQLWSAQTQNSQSGSALNGKKQ